MLTRRILPIAAAILVSLSYPVNSTATDFAAPVSYPVGTSPAIIITGDFNGDGKPDLAVANTGSNDISILLNNGGGAFKAAINSPAGTSPQGMVAGDFNGDGKLDLAVINSQNAVVFLLLGNGDGTFQAPAQVQANPAPVSVVAADFNEDGKLDLLLGDGTSDGVFLLLGKGDGTFQQATNTLFGISGSVSALAVGDFNGDKHTDVVAYISPANLIKTVVQLPGKGDGSFATAVQIGQFGGVSGVNTTTILGTVSLIPGDFNGDGKLDLAWRFERKTKSVNLFFSSCTVSNPCYSYDTRVMLFTGNGDGTFATGTTPITVSGLFRTKNANFLIPGNLAAGDFNADNKQDLLVPVSSAGHLYLGHGDGTFLSTFLLPPVWTATGSFGIAADLDGDGLPDAVVTDTANNAVIVVLNTSPTSGADLAVSVAGVPSSVVIGGGDLTYTANVLNEGPQDATGVTLTETLPAGLTFVSAAPSQGTCTGANPITCDLGALTEPNIAQVTFTVTPTTPGTLTDALHITGSQPDLNSKNDSASFTVTAVLPADISVSGTSSKTLAATGDQVTYSIQVSNAGPADAANVILTDVISDSTLAVSSVSTSLGACTPSAGTLTCAIGTLTKGSKATISFVITMGPTETLTNSLSLTSDTPDLNTGDNFATLTVLVNAANLAVSQTASAPSVSIGTQVTYTITVKNNGPAQATNVALTDIVPAIATIGSVQASQGSCAAPANGVINCALGTLAVSANATVSFGATPTTAGTMTNSVSVSSDAPDPDTSDNGSSLDVTVPDFSITASVTSLTVSRGGQGSVGLTFAAQGGFAGNIDLKCSVSGSSTPMPTCALLPTSVTPGNPSTLTVNAAGLTAALAPQPLFAGSAKGLYALCLPISFLGLALAGRFGGRRRGLAMLCVLALVAVLAAACGGGSSPPGPETFTVTVTATANPGGMQHSTQISVTVQ